MRLNAIAHVRAQTIAARISPNMRQPGQPRFSRAAISIAASANGNAKIVCEKRTNESHLLIKENIFSTTDEHRWTRIWKNYQSVGSVTPCALSGSHWCGLYRFTK